MCYPKPGPRCSNHAYVEFIETSKDCEIAEEKLHGIRRQGGSDVLARQAPLVRQVERLQIQKAKTIQDWYETKMGRTHLEKEIQRQEALGDAKNEEKLAILTSELASAQERRAIKLESYKEVKRLQAETFHNDARAAAEERQRSIADSDTDGFLSQHSSGLSAARDAENARIAEAGGVQEFPALFDLQGNLVPAKLIDSQYGPSWALLEDEFDPYSSFKGFVNLSKAKNPALRKQRLEEKGYRIGTIKAPARAELAAPEGARGMSGMGSVYVAIKRLDGGFDPDAEIVSNGQETDTE